MEQDMEQEQDFSLYYDDDTRVKRAIYTHVVYIGKNLFLPFHCSIKKDMDREKVIEEKLVRAVKKIGGLALKFVSPGYDGMPDRLLLIAKGRVAFVEVKAKGKKPRPLQVARHKKLRELGFKVYVLDDEKQIETIIQEVLKDDT